MNVVFALASSVGGGYSRMRDDARGSFVQTAKYTGIQYSEPLMINSRDTHFSLPHVSSLSLSLFPH